MPEDEDHWTILKHQVALRLSLANTGRGLVRTNSGSGDSSPYSFGTSVGMGWFRDVDGNYRDIDDAPWAAGWTGWTAMWASECGNGFIHEVGHSLTLAHFTGGSAASWGIADEYPLDGTNLETHPWGYDAGRRALRTWYRVDSGGPVFDGETLVGKRDPMNGGEARLAGVTCFPQYTAYHAWKAQNWMESTSTITEVDGVPGIYRWNAESRAYEAAEVEQAGETPTAIDVPIVTLIGTLGNSAAANQTYPALHSPSRNVFTLPDPFGDDLPADFDGARWYLEITYDGGDMDHALIARPEITDTALYLYSLNLAADPAPVTVDLYESDTGYPEISSGAHTLRHSRTIDPPREAFAPVLTMGGDSLANNGVSVGQWCEPGINCAERREQTTWRVTNGPLYFAAGDAAVAPTVCADLDGFTTLEVPVRSGELFDTLIVHAQRVVADGGSEFAVRIDDATPWVASPSMSQSLRVWIPHAENSDLPPGNWVNDGPFAIPGFLAGTPFDESPVFVDLEVVAETSVDLGSEFMSAPLTASASSMYFLVRDPTIGPTDRVWWGTGDPVLLRVPVQNTTTGELTLLHVEGLQESCGSRWQMNAGRGAGECEHQLVLNVASTGNEHLVSGHSYRTLPSAPLEVEGRRWHAPEGGRLEGLFALVVSYTAP